MLSCKWFIWEIRLDNDDCNIKSVYQNYRHLCYFHLAKERNALRKTCKWLREKHVMILFTGSENLVSNNMRSKSFYCEKKFHGKKGSNITFSLKFHVSMHRNEYFSNI